MPYAHQTTSEGATLIEHADHNWEETHAYLSNTGDRDDIPGDATGICCHTCLLVVWEV